MKVVAATHAKNLLGQVLEDASTDLVMLARHGKQQIALMPAADARTAILAGFAVGKFSRARAMKLLGFSWYGELKDAMAAEGISVVVDTEREAQMVKEAVRFLKGAV